MNYKINQLSKPVKCELTRFPDVISLKYGSLSDSKDSPVVFSVSHFCKETGADFDMDAFMKSQKLYIDRLVHESYIKAGELFYIDKDKNLYMAEELAILFLIYISDMYQLYLYDMLSDVLVNGFAVSDGFVLRMAMDRIPTRTLQGIISQRNEQEKA